MQRIDRKPQRGALALAVAVFAALATLRPAAGGSVHVAVAANFTDTAREIGRLFAQATGHRAVFSFGSTGQLFAQITQGAPFEVFLAADEERPRLAVSRGLATADSRFTYALGKIALFSRGPALVSGEATLRAGAFAKIAIANPVTAPYGAAAVEVMTRLSVYAALAPKIVQGNNIAQVYQFVATGNAELGFVALAQIIARTDGSRWIVPADYYAPIRQDAVLLKIGAGNQAALAFLAFLQSPQARAAIAGHGYGLDE